MELQKMNMLLNFCYHTPHLLPALSSKPMPVDFLPLGQTSPQSLKLVRTPAAALQRPPRIGRDGVVLAPADLPALTPQRLQIKSDLQSYVEQVGFLTEWEMLSPAPERLSPVSQVPRTAFRGTIRHDAATQLERPSSMLVPGTFYWPSAR